MFNPLIMFGVQSLIFQYVLKLNMDKYYMFLLTGLIPWIFISQTIEMTVALFVNQAVILKAFPIHPLVYISAQAIDNFINFLGSFSLLLIPIAIHSGTDPIGLLIFPISLIFIVVSTVALSFLLATMNVFYRDIRYLSSFALSILFYLTPIFYNIDFIDLKYRWLMNFNPFYHLLRPMRSSLYKLDLDEFYFSCFIALIVTLGFVLLSLLYWRRKRSEVFYYV